MSSSPYAKVALLVVLALAGGVGVAFASIPTFIFVAVTFAAGIWLLFKDSRPTSLVMEAERDESQVQESPGATFITRLVPVFLLVWWLVQVAPLLAYSPREVGERAVEATNSGSPLNQLMIISFGFVGMLCLPAALKHVNRTFWWLVGLWMLYLVWGYTSLFWSIFPESTVRNLIAFALVSIGAFGLGAGFYGARPDGLRVFFKHITVAGLLSAMVILIPLPFHLNELDLTDPSERLALSGDFTSLVSYPAMAAALVLVTTSLVGLRKWKTWDLPVIVLLILPLLILKTRGPLLWTVLTLAVVYLLCRRSVRDRILQVCLLALAGLGWYVLHINEVLSPLGPYLTRDNAEVSMSLTGRIPLWEALWPMVQQKPLLGSGFVAFWNPENLFLMERIVGFPVVVAHNGFLEELLNTGIIGLALFLAFWISTMVVAIQRVRSGDRFGWILFLFLLFYLFLNLTNSLMQEYREVPFILVFVILGLLAVRPLERDSEVNPDPEKSDGITTYSNPRSAEQRIRI